jgi:hypothetical protein
MAPYIRHRIICLLFYKSLNNQLPIITYSQEIETGM